MATQPEPVSLEDIAARIAAARTSRRSEDVGKYLVGRELVNAGWEVSVYNKRASLDATKGLRQVSIQVKTKEKGNKGWIIPNDGQHLKPPGGPEPWLVFVALDNGIDDDEGVAFFPVPWNMAISAMWVAQEDYSQKQAPKHASDPKYKGLHGSMPRLGENEIAGYRGFDYFEVDGLDRISNHLSNDIVELAREMRDGAKPAMFGNDEDEHQAKIALVAGCGLEF